MMMLCVIFAGIKGGKGRVVGAWKEEGLECCYSFEGVLCI